MRRTAVFVGVVFLVSGCATTKAAESDQGPTSHSQKISNISHFDLATCTSQELTLPQPANREVIVAALVSRRPQVMECFVDPAHRGPAQDSSVTIETTVSPQGAEHKLTGTNLTPQGEQCVRAAVGPLKLAPLPAGAAPTSGSMEFKHGAASPGVHFGKNEASDVAGAMRLATPTWCECFASWGSAGEPTTLRMKLALRKDKEVEATVEPTNEPATDAVAQCLVGKTKALALPLKSDELSMTYPFIFIDSSRASGLPNAAPELKFVQLDAQRGQAAAKVALAIGDRINAVTTYDALVAKYNAKKSFSLVKELKDKCAKLVAADDTWISALESQRQVDQATLDLATEMAAKDQAWAEAKTAAEQAVAATTADVTKANETKVADQRVCPKERY